MLGADSGVAHPLPVNTGRGVLGVLMAINL